MPLPSGRPATRDLINAPWLTISRGEMSILHMFSSKNSLGGTHSPSSIRSEKTGLLDSKIVNKKPHSLELSPLREVPASKKDGSHSKPPVRKVPEHHGRDNDLKGCDPSNTDEPALSSFAQLDELRIIPPEEMAARRRSLEEHSEKLISPKL